MPSANDTTINQTHYAILDIDPWLQPFRGDIELRMDRYRGIRQHLIGANGSFREFASGHQFYGFPRANQHNANLVHLTTSPQNMIEQTINPIDCTGFCGSDR